MAFINEKDEKGEDRTIDHERKAFLVFEGPTPADRETKRFSFHYKNQAIPFLAEQHLISNSPDKPSVIWKFSRLDIPATLADDKKIIIDLIQEAFLAYGLYYSHEHTKNVQVEYQNINF